MAGENESMRRQLAGTVDDAGYATGPMPDYPRVTGREAAEMLDAETHWVRSANLEFYYRYAVIEDARSGERLTVHRIDTESWANILAWLADPDECTTVAWDGEVGLTDDQRQDL